jgi:3-hydroxyacyl-[acyl-carrier-protein] dehydratase
MTGMRLDREAIMRIIPHRDPFLMLDRVEHMMFEPTPLAMGWKDVRADEAWAAGHFPGNPIFPGVLMTEALAQLAGVLALSMLGSSDGNPMYLVGVDKMRFRRLVKPGESLRLDVRRTEARRRMWFFEGSATVNGERACEGTFLATMP